MYKAKVNLIFRLEAYPQGNFIMDMQVFQNSKYSKSETLLVPSISDEREATCTSDRRWENRPLPLLVLGCRVLSTRHFCNPDPALRRAPINPLHRREAQARRGEAAQRDQNLAQPPPESYDSELPTSLLLDPQAEVLLTGRQQRAGREACCHPTPSPRGAMVAAQRTG